MESFWRSNFYFQNLKVFYEIFDAFIIVKVNIQSSSFFDFTLSIEKRKQGLNKIDFIVEYEFLDEIINWIRSIIIEEK
jgi:hypothetical protein